jgi:AraC family transcriptional regulator, transcriptional activator of pobA
MKLPTRSIPLYSLYGENAVIEDIEFVHIEDIASRSKLYDWEIAAHKHNGLFQIMLITEGQADAVLDNESKQLKAPCLILIPAGTVHGFHFAPSTQGRIISVALGFLEHNSRAIDQEFILEIVNQSIVLPYEPSTRQFETVNNLINQILTEFRYPQLGRAIIFDALLRTLLIHVLRHESIKRIKETSHTHQRTILNRYRTLIDTHYKQRWTVDAYAAEMCITDSKLNRICKSFTQKSAFEVMQDRILLEAQRYLIYTNASLDEIAYDLGLNDSAYFCRYFKKRTGMTPKEFRKGHDQPFNGN